LEEKNWKEKRKKIILFQGNETSSNQSQHFISFQGQINRLDDLKILILVNNNNNIINTNNIIIIIDINNNNNIRLNLKLRRNWVELVISSKTFKVSSLNSKRKNGADPQQDV
jgi:hypothetical protein